MVPSCFGTVVLLACVCNEEPDRYCVRRHELRRTFHHVLLLLPHGCQVQAKVVQQYLDHSSTNFTDGRRCYSYCHERRCATAVHEGRMSRQA